MWKYVLFLLIASAAAAETRAPASPTAPFQIRAFTLGSGLRVVLAKAPPVVGRDPRAYVGLYVRSGTMSETDLGQAHLIEHVVANSPAVDPLPPAPANAQSYAANAVTKFNYTVFVRTVSPAALQAAIYSRLARAGRIRPDASILSRERVRVVQELGRSSRQLAALKALEAYAKGRPPSLAAEVANVWAMTSDDIWTRIHANYVPRNSVLIVAGDIDLDDTAHVIGQAADALGLVAPTDITRSPRVARPAFNQPPLVIHQNDPGTFSVALGYPQPDHQSSDFPAFMVLDQLLLSERDGDPQPGATASTDRSAFATRLSARIHAFDLWDGKEAHWGAPLFSDGNPSLYTIIFSLHDLRSTEEVRAAALATLRDIRLHALSNAEIETAKSRLSAYYGQWLLEPSFRIVSDHLAALAAAGRNPEEVNDVQRQIMAVRPAAVRRMMDALIARAPLFVLLAPRA